MTTASTPRSGDPAGDAVYRLQGHTAHATEWSVGPWDASLQHGGAPAALVARAAERASASTPMRVTRLTLDLLRPIPVAALDVSTEVLREGKRIQVLSIVLSVGGTVVVRASALKVAITEPELPTSARMTPFTAVDPAALDAPNEPQRHRSPFFDGISMRRTRPLATADGCSAIWFRADRSLVAGEATTPLMRAAVAADFCNGASSTLDPSTWSYINADLSIQFARLPIGEWILLEAVTWLGTDGGGIASARLGDTTGWFGRATQSLVVERRV